MGDLELLRQWKAGNRCAGELLIRRYYDGVYDYIRGRVDTETVEDLVQSIFEVLCRTARAQQIQHGLRPHIYAIARFKLLEYYREQNKSRERYGPLPEGLEDIETNRCMTSMLSAKRDLASLCIALKRLPPDTQLLVRLKHYDRFTASEMAEMFNVTTEVMATRSQRARERLKRELDRVVRQRATDATDDEAQELRAYLNGLRCRRETTAQGPVD